MQDQGHNRTYHAPELTTTLFPFTRDAGKVHSPSPPHVPGLETTAPWAQDRQDLTMPRGRALALGSSWGGGFASTTGPSPPVCRSGR